MKPTQQPPTAFQDLLSLAKPRLSFLVILTTAAGAALAPGSMSWFTWLMTLAGSVGVVAAANTLNCWLEIETDSKMKRTANRPLPMGRLKPRTALVLGLVLAVIGIACLGLGANALTAWLGFAGFILYVAVYTPMKRYSSLALFAGAVPGAIPPVMGWTAATNSLSLEAWLLFAILFFWQLPHFIAISFFHVADYTRAGVKTFPGSLGETKARYHMIVYTAFLLLVTFLPLPLGKAGLAYTFSAALFGVAFAALCLSGFFRRQDLNWSKAVFLGSLAYLPLVLGAWVLDRLLLGY